MENTFEDALCFVTVWGAKCPNWAMVTRAHGAPRQLRALDWDTTGPFKNYAVATLTGAFFLFSLLHSRSYGESLYAKQTLVANAVAPSSIQAIVVYHPAAGEGHAWANVGFGGWTGSITGFSSQQLALSEIGVSYPDARRAAARPLLFVFREFSLREQG